MAGCVLRIEAEGIGCPTDLTPASQSSRGFVVEVGDADGDRFPDQMQQAIAFLERHGEELRRISSSPGFRVGELDFGVWNKGIPAQSHSFSPVLARLASQCGLALTITLYAADS